GAGFRRVQAAAKNQVGYNSGGQAIARDPADNSIYVAGNADDSDERTAMAVTRFTPNGTLDTSFGTGGTKRVQTAPGTTRMDISSAIAVAVQADGKIVLAGQSTLPGGVQALEAIVLRLDATGNLDPTFGNGGIVRLQTSTATIPVTLPTGLS